MEIVEKHKCKTCGKSIVILSDTNTQEVFAFCDVCDKDRYNVAKAIADDFDYEIYDLMTDWNWIKIEEDPGMYGEIFFDGKYVFFANGKTIWY